jgi:hypothetical protein
LVPTSAVLGSRCVCCCTSWAIAADGQKKGRKTGALQGVKRPFHARPGWIIQA